MYLSPTLDLSHPLISILSSSLSFSCLPLVAAGEPEQSTRGELEMQQQLASHRERAALAVSGGAGAGSKGEADRSSVQREGGAAGWSSVAREDGAACRS
jgi:hypothetical protein